jgi:phage-related protein
MAGEPQPYWPWCATAGAARTTQVAVDEVAYGDGYKHRATRGLNPARPSWSLGFPFESVAELKERDDFLKANAARGFWFTPPDSADYAFVTADEWSATIVDRSGKGAMVGTLSVTLVRSFNPQPNPIIR